MHTRHLLALIAFFLAGCTSVATPPAMREYGRLVLHETLVIPPDAASARLQYGRTTASNAVQEQDPFCIFEIETVATTAQNVPPGEFAVTGMVRSVETFAGMPVFRPLRVSIAADDGPTLIYYKTVFRLDDARRSVRALSCMSNQNAPGNASSMRHLTLGEIRGALGPRFTLEIDGAR